MAHNRNTGFDSCRTNGDDSERQNQTRNGSPASNGGKNHSPTRLPVTDIAISGSAAPQHSVNSHHTTSAFANGILAQDAPTPQTPATDINLSPPVSPSSDKPSTNTFLVESSSRDDSHIDSYLASSALVSNHTITNLPGNPNTLIPTPGDEGFVHYTYHSGYSVENYSNGHNPSVASVASIPRSFPSVQISPRTINTINSESHL